MSWCVSEKDFLVLKNKPECDNKTENMHNKNSRQLKHTKTLDSSLYNSRVLHRFYTKSPHIAFQNLRAPNQFQNTLTQLASYPSPFAFHMFPFTQTKQQKGKPDHCHPLMTPQRSHGWGLPVQPTNSSILG